MKASERAGQVAVRFPPPLLEKVDEVRLARLDQPDRSTIIRELVALGIDALERRKK
jgi:metal-responsive CopG/Arc/MetJ family transcriptional regulator